MTEKEVWSKIRVINYLLQNIDDAMGERDVKTSIKYCLMGIQEEGFIPSFELIEKGDLLRIDIPGMFFLEFDPNRKATAIRTVYHFDNGYVEVRMDAGAYVAAVKEEKEMIPILEFSSAEHRDIRPGYPEPGIFHPGWYCSICGKLVPAGHSACHMHEVDRYISGTFCATSGANIPDHADEIKFVVDSLIITLKCVVIRPSPNTNGNKIVPSAPIDAQCKRVYYTFDASSIEYDTGEEQEENG